MTGLFDPNSDHINRAREIYSDAATGDDLEGLIETISPDIVAVAGPDYLHADQAILALDRGCHGLVEKPMATTVADAERMISPRSTPPLQKYSRMGVRRARRISQQMTAMSSS